MSSSSNDNFKVYVYFISLNAWVNSAPILKGITSFPWRVQSWKTSCWRDSQSSHFTLHSVSEDGNTFAFHWDTLRQRGGTMGWTTSGSLKPGSLFRLASVSESEPASLLFPQQELALFLYSPCPGTLYQWKKKNAPLDFPESWLILPTRLLFCGRKPLVYSQTGGRSVEVGGNATSFH